MAQGSRTGGSEMLTIYKIEMASKPGYWEATCGVDGRELAVQACVWIDPETRELMVVPVPRKNCGVAVGPHWPEIDKAIREAVVARCAQ